MRAHLLHVTQEFDAGARLEEEMDKWIASEEGAKVTSPQGTAEEQEVAGAAALVPPAEEEEL